MITTNAGCKLKNKTREAPSTKKIKLFASAKFATAY
jgi:hypothetical protein